MALEWFKNKRWHVPFAQGGIGFFAQKEKEHPVLPEATKRMFLTINFRADKNLFFLF